MTPHLHQFTNGYTYGLKITPRFYDQFSPDDERDGISPLNQIDTVYEFDAPHIRLQRFSNVRHGHDTVAQTADGQTIKIKLAEVFAPMATAFEPKLVYLRDRRFGKLQLTTQLPSRQVPAQCTITVNIVDPSQFSLLVITGMVSYRLAYNWESRLCVY